MLLTSALLHKVERALHRQRSLKKKRRNWTLELVGAKHSTHRFLSPTSPFTSFSASHICSCFYLLPFRIFSKLQKFLPAHRPNLLRFFLATSLLFLNLLVIVKTKIPSIQNGTLSSNDFSVTSRLRLP